MMVHRHCSGFTLIELMVTLAVAIILMASLVPAYTAVVQRNEVTSNINAFVGELKFARSEALKRGAVISLCPATTGSTSCNTASSRWSPSVSGERLVFVDIDADGEFDGTDVLLKRVTTNSTTVAVSVVDPSPEPAFLRFSPNGLLTAAAASIQFSGAGGTQRCVSLTLTGRSTVASGGCS
jgi:type IV fimbrial biogenesis protein FimT